MFFSHVYFWVYIPPPDAALQPPPEIPWRATSPLRLAGREVRAGYNMNQESSVPSPPHGSSSAPAPSLASKEDTRWWPPRGPRWHACSWRWIARCPAALHPNRLPSVFPNFGPGNRSPSSPFPLLWCAWFPCASRRVISTRISSDLKLGAYATNS